MMRHILRDMCCYANLMWLLEIRGLRRKDAAAILDLSPQEFSLRLRRTGFTPAQQQRLARALNCSHSWLFDADPQTTLMQRDAGELAKGEAND
jgi:hypothetical protein